MRSIRPTGSVTRSVLKNRATLAEVSTFLRTLLGMLVTERKLQRQGTLRCTKPENLQQITFEQ